VPKTWIITGSSRGLGRVLAEATLVAGEKVAAPARRVDDLQDLKDRYRDQVLLLPLDVTNETQVIEAVTSTIRNSAGWTCFSTMPDTEMSRQSKIQRSKSFALRLKPIFLAPSFSQKRCSDISANEVLATSSGDLDCWQDRADWPRSFTAAKWGVEGFS